MTPSKKTEKQIHSDRESNGAVRILRELVRPGSTVAVGDGAGSPLILLDALTVIAREVEGIRLLLGWCFELSKGFSASLFGDVRSFMGSDAVRRTPGIHYVPARFGTLPALFQGPWRPDILLASAREGENGLLFCSEVGWIASATEAAKHVVIELNESLPCASRCQPISNIKTVVGCQVSHPPIVLNRATPNATEFEVGRQVASLIPPGAVIQYGPGSIGEAVLRSINSPVSIDSGVITDAVVDLADRDLLMGQPRAAYVVGTDRLYAWADGRRIVDRAEVTHDPTRLACEPLFAINTALEIDQFGQINVETINRRLVAGVGGHADYANAAAKSATGLSVIALPSARRGQSTLVRKLASPTSTSRSDIDVVVTERGVADLRGRTDHERQTALCKLWGIEG